VSRWVRLIAAVVSMIMIANLQYAWTLFVKPLIADHHWKLRDVQFAFSIFVACQTWFMPAAGWVMDRIGPRVFMTVAGVICGIGWAALGQAGSLPMLYAFYAAAGIGAVLVYCGSMGVALKWFPDKRGLAAGITAAAFGSGHGRLAARRARVVADGSRALLEPSPPRPFGVEIQLPDRRAVGGAGVVPVVQ